MEPPKTVREQLATIKTLDTVLQHVPLAMGSPKLITTVILTRAVTNYMSSICVGYPIKEYEFVYMKPASGDDAVLSLNPAGGNAASKQKRFDLATVDAKIGPLLWQKLQNTGFEAKIGAENSSAFRILRKCASAGGQNARATLDYHKAALKRIEIDPTSNRSKAQFFRSLSHIWDEITRLALSFSGGAGVPLADSIPRWADYKAQLVKQIGASVASDPAVETVLLNATTPKEAIDACVTVFEKKMTLESSEVRIERELEELDEAKVAAARGTPTNLKHERQPGHDGPQCKSTNCSCVECDNYQPKSAEPCQFYGIEGKGPCRRGDKCRFTHSGPEVKGKKKHAKKGAGKNQKPKCPDGVKSCKGKHEKGKCPVIKAMLSKLRTDPAE